VVTHESMNKYETILYL